MLTARRRIGWYARTAGTVVAVFAFVRVASAQPASIAIQASWMRQVLNAVQMSTATFDDTPSYVQRNGFQVYGNFPNIVATEEEETETSKAIDNTIVAKMNDECYVAWRGTDQEMREDWEQNFDFTARTVANCQVHTGFDRNYSQRDQVDQAIHDCLASCGSSQHCPLVLTGHSQGGATAAIASLYWKDENPIVITFGAPRAIHSSCYSLQADNHYRFVTVTTASGRMQYDLVPMVPTVGGRHYGHAFLLNDNAHLAYLGLNDDKTRTAALPSVSVHSVDVYVERIEQLHSQLDTYPVYNSGWNNNEACGSDDECLSGRCAETGIGGLFGGLHCQALLESCGTCRRDSDCDSGKCVYFLTALRSVCAADSSGRMDDGCVCDWSSDCRSGRCEGTWPPYRCEARLEAGEGCNENADCQSGKCDGWAWNLKCQ